MATEIQECVERAADNVRKMKAPAKGKRGNDAAIHQALIAIVDGLSAIAAVVEAPAAPVEPPTPEDPPPEP